MVSVRAAKSKGSQFEYDCQHSLQKLFPDIYRTAERGFQRQYDLRDDKSKTVFECKRLKGISWNQLEKFHDKMVELANDAQNHFLLFQSNRQPCLVFYWDHDGFTVIRKFKDVFGTDFEKHPSTRAPKSKPSD